MNKRKLLSTMVFFVFFTFSLWGNASAEDNGAWCSTVKVLAAGASSASKVIYAQNPRTDCGSSWPANTSKWFVLDDSGSNASAMLAVALTAQATGKTVTLVGTNGVFSDWSVLTHVSIVSP